MTSVRSPLARLLDSVSGRLTDERGIALVMALGILTMLSIALTGIIYFTGTNSRSSSYAKAEQVSVTLAEAGINNALGVIFNRNNNVDLEYAQLLPVRTNTYAGGNVSWWGVLVEDMLNADPAKQLYWQITAKGMVKNPTGPGVRDITRTLTRRVYLRPPPETKDALEIWNWIYTHRTGFICDMTIDQSVALESPLYVRGNLCLRSTATITNGPLIVGRHLVLDQPANSVGFQIDPILNDVRVGGYCRYKNFAPVDPCKPNRADTNVWVGPGKFKNDPSDYGLTLPGVWWAARDVGVNPPANASPDGEVGWYEKGSPGPYYPCKTVSGTPPVFDTGAPDGFNRSVPGVFDLAPPAQSYTCKTRRGQLSWNHATRTLTVRGAMFIDGSAKIENNSGVIRYVQQAETDSTGAVIYLGGTLLIKNSIVCGALTWSGTDCSYAADASGPGWDPNKNLLVFSAYSQGGQVPVATGIQVVSSTFQGAFYARYAIDASTTSKTQGPMISESEVKLGQTNGVDFPDVKVVPIGMPGFGPEYFAPINPEFG